MPQIAVAGVSDIQNHSQIWVFYKTENGRVRAKMNRKNSINTTHWIIHIDKRLPLSEVIPTVNKLKKKHAKKTIHSAEGMKNYLSYFYTGTRKLALFPIDDIHYESSSEQIQEEQIGKHTLVFSGNTIKLNEQTIPLDKWSKTTLDTLTSGCVQLIFDATITYNDYMKYRMQLTDFVLDSVKLDKRELIRYE